MMPEIAATSERMVYSVASSGNPAKRYRVDLIANNGNGGCSCTDFGTRRQPLLDAGHDGFTAEASCKHLRKVRNYFLRELLHAMAKSEES